MKAIYIVCMIALIGAMMMPAAAQTLTCPYDICVNETGWWRNGEEFHAAVPPLFNSFGTGALDHSDGAKEGETVFVYNGTYGQFHFPNPNVRVIGEGADVVTVNCGGSEGICMPSGSSGTNATGCVLEGVKVVNSGCGVRVGTYGSASNTIIRNCIFDGLTGSDGVVLEDTNTTFENNVIVNATGDCGCIGVYGSSCTIVNNSFIGATLGAGIAINCGAANNIVARNNIISNEYAGIELYEAGEGNKIYLNNFVDNGVTVTISETWVPTTIFWNSTEPIEYTYGVSTYTNYLGNYWSDYGGTDVDGDGIGDSNYVVPDGLGNDFRPLVAPFEDYPAPIPQSDLTPTAITAPALFAGEPNTISATIANTGTLDAGGFNVSLSANGNPVDTASVGSLGAGDSTDVSFTWTPAGAGSYNLCVVADSGGDVDESDETNNQTCETVDVVMAKATVFFDPSDIRADGFCNTETVGIWINTSEAIKGGAAVFDYTASCANITGYTPDTMWEFMCNADLSTPGTVSLGFGTLKPAGYGPGLLHIMDIDVHCSNESSCCGTVLDWDTDIATSYVQNMTNAKIPVKWDDGTFLCGDAINITKKVWDGSAWVDAIGPLGSEWMGQDVKFNITVTSGCLDLSGVTVDDVMDSSLQYNNNANPPASSNTTNTAIWNLGALAAYASTSIEFNATIVEYGKGFNTATVTATVTNLGIEVSEEADASVTTMPPAGIDVNKTVWDPNAGAWVDVVTGATIGETYRFKCEMHNSGSPGMDLTSIIVRDVLSDSLEYAGSARLQTPSGVWRDINPPDINDPENNTVGWTIDDWLQDPLTLQPCQTITIEFNATVVDYGYDCNEQIATAWCAEAGQPVTGNDTACIETPEPDLNVTKITVNPDVPYLCDKAFGPTNHTGAKTQCNNISAEIIEGTGIDVVYPFDVTFEIDGVPVCTVNVPGLAGGASKTVYCNCSWYPFADETDTITVTVDSADAVPETDEGNNTLARDVTAHVNGWKGDSHQDGRNITTKQCHEEGTINLLYSVGNSSYLSESSNPGWTDYTVGWTAGDLAIPPEDSCIKKARLYVYYAWDKSAGQNVTDYFDMEFNGYPVAQDGVYNDTKFPDQPDPCVCDCELLGYPVGADNYYHMCTYSYGYGMVAYDVADEFVITGNTAHLTSSYPAAASMQGMLLVVVYNHTAEPERIIWINEGFDILKSGFTKYTKNPTTYGPSGVTSEEATVYAPFTDCEPIPMDEVVDATLVTITNDAKDAPSKDSNRLYFNGEHLASGAWTEPAPGSPGAAAIGHNVADVRTLLKATDNTAAFQSHDPGDMYGGDSMEACNAFLIVQKAKPEMSAEPDSDECYHVNEQFDVLVNITPRGAPIMGAQFDLHFNASVLQAETVTYGDFLMGEGSVFVSHSDIDNLNGVVSFAAARQSTPNGVTAPGTFGIVHFTAMAQGANSELVLMDALASTNSTPVETIDLVTDNGTARVCSNSIPTAVAKSDFRRNNIAEKGLSKAYFNGTKSFDPEPGTITYWRWWVDDGSSLVGETAVHLFEVPMYWSGDQTGHYVPANVTLTVTDDGIPLMDGSDSMDVTVWIAGDTTGDGRVNIADAVTFGMQFGATCSIDANGLRWYNNLEGDKADLNNDARVNIGDAMLLGTCWGHTAW